MSDHDSTVNNPQPPHDNLPPHIGDDDFVAEDTAQLDLSETGHPVRIPDPVSEPDESALRDIRELTVAQLVSAMFQQPRQTWAAFRDVLQSPLDTAQPRLIRVDTVPRDAAGLSVTGWLQDRKIVRLALYFLAISVAIFGNVILLGGETTRRSEEIQLAAGWPWLIAAMLIWAIAELYAAWPQIVNRARATASPPDESPSPAAPVPAVPDVWYMQIPPQRLVYALIAMILSIVTWFGTSGNQITLPVFLAWVASVALWVMTFAPVNFDLFAWARAWRDRLQQAEWRRYAWVIVTLSLVIGIGFFFRFHNLDQHPREMTDDHVEKILDAGLVRNGYTPIFFANNGGREPFQMYAIAVASHLPGLGINHYTIKWVAAIESLLTIPVVFFMAYELTRGEQRQRRILIALITAALLAVSYWHVAITRQGLRIPLTALVVALELVYLSRAIRYNHRADYIKAGLVLGVGLYMYQAVRMLPVVIVVAVFAAIVFLAKTWRQRLQYVLNLSVLVAISFSIFIPMFHYSLEYPDLFWRRTAGRLLGDDVIQEVQPDGTIRLRDATVEERLTAFTDNLPTIADNMRNVLLMFNWRGDIATISGVPAHPTLDLFSGALLVVGVVGWGVLAIRRRDLFYWLIPVVILILLLPSALSIAFPGENPSHTRTSGAIPLIYLIAALPLALIIETVLSRWQGRFGRMSAIVIAGVLIGSSYSVNARLYFDEYPSIYEASFDPYSDAGAYLQGFILQGGSYGNAFLVGYEHWWSHRAVGLAGGLDEFWPNGIYPRENIAQAVRDATNRDGKFRLEPDVDLIFYYAPADEETGAYLSELFPQGTATEFPTYKPNETFMIYRVPALGADELTAWLEIHAPRS